MSSASVNDIAFLNSGGSITFNNIYSTLGRVGARVGTNFVAGNLALQPFVTANVSDEFAGPNIRELSACLLLSSDSDFARRCLRPVWARHVWPAYRLRNLLGYIRADVRTGTNIDGWDLTCGVKYQF